MIMSREKAIEIARQFANRVYEEIDRDAKVFLFGSAARDEAHSSSDIDIAVVSAAFGFDVVENRVRLLMIGYDLAEGVEPHPILLKEWDKNQSFLASEIQREGILV